jgi:hypothetical protein
MADKDLIKSAVNIAVKLKNIPFPVLIEATSGYKLVQLDLTNNEDDELFDNLTKSANNLIKMCNKTRRRFQGDRINEVGNAIEAEFVQEIRTTNIKPNLLSESGYPDMDLIDKYGRKTYLESKATSKNWDDTFRAFYYTTGKKITSDARHLLIGWKVEEERDKYWKLIDWKLIDLYYLKIKLKSEFNATNKDIYICSKVLAEGKQKQL